MARKDNKQDQRLTRAQKDANDKQWYKDKADELDTSNSSIGHGNYSEYKRMKVNYDLMNNILDLKDFEYVCEPYGAEAGELPAQMVNRDIVSGKIKSVLGMEMKRPFSWKVIATNQEATTRKEQEEFGMIQDYTVNSIIAPIRIEIEKKYAEKIKGGELNKDEIQQIQQEVQKELEARTPPEVKRYMEREYQDPAEVLSHQLLEYLIQKFDIKKKFNDVFKHALLSAKGIMFVGILNGEPQPWVVNPLRFNVDKTSDEQFIEYCESASCEYRMHPSQVVAYFGDELTQPEIDKIYSNHRGYSLERLRDSLFTFEEYADEDEDTTRVLHTVWKSLRRIGFLSFKDENGDLQLDMVDEDYVLDKSKGDISITWEWIPEVYETWKIDADIYKKMRPFPGQFTDMDTIYDCKLPYYGAIYDNMNSQETSLMDRMKVYQYYYNIVMYRLELLLASDKGKKVLMNINAIPDSAGINIKQWQYFMESTSMMWYDPSEEGSGYSDANTVAKSIDLSTATDIQKYIEIAEYLRIQCGRSVGITDNVEGQTSASEAVSNAKQNLIQSSNILEPYYELHNHVKKNVLQALVDTAKVAYADSKPRKLTYVLDDMSRQVIDMDVNLLRNSTLGIFVANSTKAEEAKDLIRQLTHAAMQNQTVELSDVISVIRQEGIVEAEETLKVAEKDRRKREAEKQTREIQANAAEAEKDREFKREEHENTLEEIRVKGEEQRKTEVVKFGLTGASFNPDQDVDNDGVNDFLEIARDGLDADIKRKGVQLDREKFEEEKKQNKIKNRQEDKKIKESSKKSNSQK